MARGTNTASNLLFGSRQANKLEQMTKQQVSDAAHQNVLSFLEFMAKEFNEELVEIYSTVIKNPRSTSTRTASVAMVNQEQKIIRIRISVVTDMPYNKHISQGKTFDWADVDAQELVDRFWTEQRVQSACKVNFL